VHVVDGIVLIRQAKDSLGASPLNFSFIFILIDSKSSLFECDFIRCMLIYKQ